MGVTCHMGSLPPDTSKHTRP